MLHRWSKAAKYWKFRKETALTPDLPVKFRLFINPFDKQFRLFLPPCFECLNRTSVFQSALRYAVVVGVEIELECLAQVCSAGKPCLRHQITNAPVETLDHAVGLGMAWRTKPILDGQPLAREVKDLFARSSLARAGRAVRELAAVVRQKRLDHTELDTYPSQRAKSSFPTASIGYPSNKTEQAHTDEISRGREVKSENCQLLEGIHCASMAIQAVQNHVPVATWWLHEPKRKALCYQLDSTGPC